jgi:hypothetical protein
MNNPIDRGAGSDGAWPSSDRQPPVPDTSMLPGAEGALIARIVR